jgi:hypothetical protein
MTWCVLASKKKRECFFVICQCDKLCVCWAVAQASTFRPSNVAPIILTNSVWYVRKTQKYIFFNVEETMKSVPFSLKKIGVGIKSNGVLEVKIELNKLGSSTYLHCA